mmetsp:Transcript_9048/g.36535  ORF Transcript_9048/g.36535 Transcript_9048/m.36535 type:complete len:486 (-) Transcript_9048:25-1482(-)
MFGDVYSNRGNSLPDSPAGGEPSPLLTRLLIPGEQHAEDGSGSAARTTTRDGHGEPPPPSSGAGIDIRRSPAGVESESSRRPLLGGGDSPRGVDVPSIATRPFHRDAPLPSTSSSDRIYAFDPWTKVPVILRRRPSDDDDDDDRARPPRVLTLRWCWLADDPSWWVAFCYLVGSVGFAAGALASCFARVAASPRLYLALEVTPYVAGGCAFLVASCLLVWTSYNARYGEPGRADRRRVARRHAFLGHVGDEWQLRAAVGERGVVGVDAVGAPVTDADRSELHTLTQAMAEARALWLANDSWTRRRRALELVGSLVMLLGVILYKVMVFTMLARATLGDERVAWSEMKENWLMFYPCVAGSAAFVASSYVLWCAANRSWRPPWFPSSTSTWIAYLSLVGSWCWVLGSARASRGFGARTAAWIPGSTPGWPIPFFGFFLGSLLFTAQSLLMVHEIAENEEENARGGRGRGVADAEVGDARAGGRNRR